LYKQKKEGFECDLNLNEIVELGKKAEKQKGQPSLL
jgi:hypothetical protein